MMCAMVRFGYVSLALLAVQGSLPPQQPDPQQHCKFHPTTSFDGHDIDRAVAKDAGACCALCSARLGCTAWTLYSGECYMKDSTAGRKACAACSSGLPPPCAGFDTAVSCPVPRCTWDGEKSGCTPPPWTPPAELPTKWEMSGITFTGGRYCPNVTMGNPASSRSLAHLASTGASWVAIVVTQYQWRLNRYDDSTCRIRWQEP
jgi:hypothetical protein